MSQGTTAAPPSPQFMDDLSKIACKVDLITQSSLRPSYRKNVRHNGTLNQVTVEFLARGAQILGQVFQRAGIEYKDTGTYTAPGASANGVFEIALNQPHIQEKMREGLMIAAAFHCAATFRKEFPEATTEETVDFGTYVPEALDLIRDLNS